MPTSKKAPRASKPGATIDTVRALALALPGVEEGTSYGTPGWKAKGKLMARLKEDGETLVVRIEPEARDLLMRSEPETFFVTDHYVGHPWVLVSLPRVERAALATLLEEAWRLVAPARLASAKLAPAKAKGAVESPRGPHPPAPSPAARERGRRAEADPLERLRAICLAQPEAEERVSHGAPTFFARGKSFVMFADNHHGDGRVAAWIKAPPGAQEALIAADPRRWFRPPYVGPSGWVGARLDLEPHWGAVEACIVDGHAMVTPARVTPARVTRARRPRRPPGRRPS
jgi:hypothetical protein